MTVDWGGCARNVGASDENVAKVFCCYCASAVIVPDCTGKTGFSVLHVCQG